MYKSAKPLLLIRPLLLIVAVLLAACATTPDDRPGQLPLVDLTSQQLPRVAAEFTTLRRGEADDNHHHHDADPQRVVWRFWRDDSRIVIDRPQLGVGELWQRDGRALLHHKLYHQDRRAIEFQEDDLKMLETKPAWQKLALLVDHGLLEKLTASDVEWSDGLPIREYHGQVDDWRWRVVMRLDIGLPLSIVREKGDVSETTELVNAYPLDKAPWQAKVSDDYDVIDFADLGDKEYDPFVVKVQSQMGHEHHH